jgi:enoyl-CoA hydratase/carnithine racemase
VQFVEVKKRDEVKALIITGTDPAFCSGADIENFKGSAIYKT